MIRPPGSSRRKGNVTLEIVLTLAAIVVALGWWLKASPIQLDAPTEAARTAPAPRGTSMADVLVVLPTVPEASSFETLSFDQIWLNTLEREVGATQIVESSQLSRAVLDGSAWAIVPRRAASQLDPTQTQFIRNWVEDGGVVILEQPEGPWRGLIGQPLGSQRARETRRITSFDGALSRGDLRADILEMPFRTSLAPYAPPGWTRGRDFQVLLEVDGLPGVVSLHIGRGHVLLLLFDFGRLATQMMQGLPNGDFTLRSSTDPDRPEGLQTTSDLIADPQLSESRIPFVDLLERNLLYLADVHRPVARLWSYPGVMRGALLAGHGAASYGPAAAFMPHWERGNNGRSTTFVTSGSMSPEELARFGRINGDVQLQWLPATHPQAPARSWGLGNFQPLRRTMTLDQQLDELKAALHPYGPPRNTRSLSGLWSDNYFSAFRSLEAAGIFMDSSYGPSTLSTDSVGGYLFGTGRPFHPLDRNGNLFQLYELPLAFDASVPGYSVQRFRSMLIDSAEGYHSIIAVDWPPDVMVRAPSYDAIEGWQSSFGIAASQEIWVATWEEYAGFLEARNQSNIRSNFIREERRLTIEASLIAGPIQNEDELPATPSIAFPARFEGRPVDRITVDGTMLDTAQLALTGDRVLHLLQLDPGEHRVQVYYGSTSVETPN